MSSIEETETEQETQPLLRTPGEQHVRYLRNTKYYFWSSPCPIYNSLNLNETFFYHINANHGNQHHI